MTDSFGLTYQAPRHPPEMFGLDYHTLFGIAGGQLEFMGMKIEDYYNPETGKWEKLAVLTFTDHDLISCPIPHLRDGRFYDLKFPLA